MAAIPRPVLLRPVEYTWSGSYPFHIGATNYTTFPLGVWANALSLAHSVVAEICNEGTYTIALSMSDDFLIGLTPSGSSPTITWDDTDLRDILGFTGASTALTNGATTYATYTPEYCWIPTYEREDQDFFKQNIREVAKGSISHDGTYSGISTGGTDVYSQQITFPMEIETNLLISARESDAYKKERCLETFLIGALTAFPSDATYVSPKGFWFYVDINDAISDCSLSTTEPWAEATDIGIAFEYTSGADKKVFCSTSPSQVDSLRNKPGLPVTRERWQYTFSMQTCPVPTAGWQYVDYTP